MKAKDWSTVDNMKLRAEYGLQNMGPGNTEKDERASNKKIKSRKVTCYNRKKKNTNK